MTENGQPQDLDFTLTRPAALKRGQRGRRFLNLAGIGADGKESVAVWTIPADVGEDELAEAMERLKPGAALSMTGRFKGRKWRDAKSGDERRRSEFHTAERPRERTVGPKENVGSARTGDGVGAGRDETVAAAPDPDEAARRKATAALERRKAADERRKTRPGMLQIVGSHAANILQHATPHPDQDEPQHLAAITAHLGKLKGTAKMIADTTATTFTHAKEDAQEARRERLERRFDADPTAPKPSKVPFGDLDTSVGPAKTARTAPKAKTRVREAGLGL